MLALLGDGGAAYTNQCFWTQAREGLNVTSVIFANRAYNILNVEYERLGIGEPGEIAGSLFIIFIDNAVSSLLFLCVSVKVKKVRFSYP